MRHSEALCGVLQPENNAGICRVLYRLPSRKKCLSDIPHLRDSPVQQLTVSTCRRTRSNTTEPNPLKDCKVGAELGPKWLQLA